MLPAQAKTDRRCHSRAEFGAQAHVDSNSPAVSALPPGVRLGVWNKADHGAVVDGHIFRS